MEIIKDPDNPNLKELIRKLEENTKAQSKAVRSIDDEIESISEESDCTKQEITSSFKELVGNSYDYVKHITTLATGSIIGLAALLEVGNPGADLREAINTTLAWLLFSIISCVVGMGWELLSLAKFDEFSPASDTEDPEKKGIKAIASSIWKWIKKIVNLALWSILFLARTLGPLAFVIGLSEIAFFFLRR